MKAVPLLALLVLALPCPAQAQESDPFAGDNRLLKKHTIKAVGIPLQELLEQLSKETGISFTAGSRVAEDKIFLFANDRPLVDILRIIAKFFNFYWGKTGDPPAYILSQSLKQVKLEDEEIDSNFFRAADQIAREVAFILSVGSKTPEQLNEVRDQIQRAIAGTNNPPTAIELQMKLLLIHHLMRSGYPLLGAKILGAYDREAIVKLLKTSPIHYYWPQEPGKLEMPAAMRDEILRLCAVQNAANKVDFGDFNFAALTLASSTGTKPIISGTVRAGVKDQGRTSSSGAGFHFPYDSLYPLRQRDNPVEPDGWKSVSELAQDASLKVRVPSGFAFPKREPFQPPAMARSLAAIMSEKPIDVISDAFYGTAGANLTLENIPLGRILTSICTTAGHRWQLEDGFITVRDLKYASMRRTEPSFDMLRKWASQSTDEIYSLNRLAEISDQLHPQYETTVRVLAEIGAIDGGGSTISSSRDALMFWNRLTNTQRNRALSEAGLKYTDLNRDQRAAFELASTKRLAPESGGENSHSWNPMDLAVATLHVTRREFEMWGIRTSTGHSAGGGTREQALERHRKDDPSLKLDDIKRASMVSYIFQYRSPGFRSSSHLNLPLVWLDAD